MKKLILLFLLFYSFAYSQVDTANWSFLPNQTNGKFTALISRELYYGISGGQYKQMSLSATSYDSTVFQLIPNQLDGRYTMIENIATYYGKDSGTVQIPVVFDIGTIFADTSNIAYTNIENSFSSTQTFNDIVVNGTVNGVAYSPFDSLAYVLRSAFSQTITATGGSINLVTESGLLEDITINAIDLPTVIDRNGGHTMKYGSGASCYTGILNGSGTIVISYAGTESTSIIFCQNLTASGVLKVSGITSGQFTVTSTLGAADSGGTFFYKVYGAR